MVGGEETKGSNKKENVWSCSWFEEMVERMNERISVPNPVCVMYVTATARGNGERRHVSHEENGGTIEWGLPRNRCARQLWGRMPGSSGMYNGGNATAWCSGRCKV